MSIKTILMAAGSAEASLPALRFAFGLAKSWDAHLRVLYATRHPDVYTGLYAEAAAYSDQLQAEIEEREAKRLEKLKQLTANLAGQYGMAMTASGSGHGGTVDFIHHQGDEDAVLARYGRISDLIVVSQEVNAHYPLIPALFDTGRPVMMVPPEPDGVTQEWHGQTAAIGWNGSLPAARAVQGALPLLAEAKEVHLIMVRGHNESVDFQLEEGMMGYLRAHGLNPRLSAVARDGASVGETLLMTAGQLHCNYLVLGAYGHSMMRELILGGVTQHVLDKANLPVVLAH